MYGSLVLPQKSWKTVKVRELQQMLYAVLNGGHCSFLKNSTALSMKTNFFARELEVEL